MTTDPLVQINASAANRIAFGERLAALAYSATEMAFGTKSSARGRIELRANGPVGPETVTIRLGMVGGGPHQSGLNLLHRRDGRIVLRVEDTTLHARPNGSLSKMRTMHDHRAMIQRWHDLWRTAAAPDPKDPRRREPLELAAAYVGACVANSGHNNPLALVIGVTPFKGQGSLKIVPGSATADPTHLPDAFPETSKRLLQILNPMLPIGATLSQDLSLSDTLRVEPLTLGAVQIERPSPTEAMRIMRNPAFTGMPFTLDG